MRAFSRFRPRFQALITETSIALVGMWRSKHCDTITPDLDLHHVQPARMLRRVVKLEPRQDSRSFGGFEGLVERSSGSS
jgi:hypothetical protein